MVIYRTGTGVGDVLHTNQMMRYLRTVWWSIRQRLVPLRGMRAHWRGYEFLLFLDDSTCQWLWNAGFDSLYEFHWLSQALLQPGDVVIDVGANYGYTATIFSKAVGPTGCVLAVEAAPHTVARLKKQLAAAEIRNVIPISAAVSSEIGIARMRVSFEGRQDCQYVMVTPQQAGDSHGYLSEEILVRKTRLENIVHASDVADPVLVKIDIEGGEIQALQGATELLNVPNPPWLFVEVQRMAQENNGLSPDQLLDELGRYSTTWFRFDGMRQFLPAAVEGIRKDANTLSYFNLLVCPPRGKYRDRKVQPPDRAGSTE